MMKLKLCCLAVLLMSSAHAVQLSEDGLGEALIVPFYTVKNDLKTQVVVKNFTPEVKAISVKFKEKYMGIHVLNFNMYLAPFDEWRGELSRVTHNIWGDAAQIETLDNSCVPFMSIEQDFLPYEIENYFPNSVDFMQRSHIGYIEVIEMGTLSPADAALVDHGASGMPSGCATVEIRVTPFSNTDNELVVATYQFSINSVDDCGFQTSIDEVTISKVRVYPNPTQGKVNFDIFSAKQNDVEMVIYNAIGKVEITDKIKINKGNNTISRSFEKLQKGMHFVYFNNGLETKMLKLNIN